MWFISPPLFFWANLLPNPIYFHSKPSLQTLSLSLSTPQKNAQHCGLFAFGGVRLCCLIDRSMSNRTRARTLSICKLPAAAFFCCVYSSHTVAQQKKKQYAHRCSQQCVISLSPDAPTKDAPATTQRAYAMQSSLSHAYDYDNHSRRTAE